MVQYRQWVLSLPFSLRMMAARDPALRSEVLRILLQRVFAWQRRQARELGIDDPKPAAVSFLHLFGSALNVHPHSHSLLPDAVFRRRAGQVEIVPLLAPTDEEVQAICEQVARRVLRRVEARLDDGVDLGDDHTALAPVPSPLPMLWAHRDEGAFEHPADRGRRCAEVEGFSLHAGVAVAAEDRVGLERLCRYGLRPSFALERLSLLDDGRVRYRLKRPWPRPGGVTELVLDPVDFLARLTALIPAPRVNMCRYHGVFAPASPLRGLVVPRQAGPCKHAQAFGAVKTGTAGGWPGSSGADRGHGHAHWQDDVGVDEHEHGHGHGHGRGKAGFGPPGDNAASPRHETALRYLLGTMPADEELLPLRARRLDWAALLARVFDVDVLKCPRCPNGRMEVIAAISELPVVAKILAHLKLPTALPQPCPARAPPWSEDELDLDDDDLDVGAASRLVRGDDAS
jgi:Putative transposase